MEGVCRVTHSNSPIPSRRSVRAALLVLLAGLAAAPWTVLADEVILTNGDRLSGEMRAFSETSLRLDTPHSGTLEIARRHIRNIRTDAPVVVELVSGERVIGRIDAAEARTLAVHSATLGVLRVALDAVAGLAPVAQRPAVAQAAPLPEPALAARGKGAQGPPAAQAAAAPPQIGQRPEDEEDIRRIFLRQSSVLLAPGEMELEIGANYLSNQAALTVLNARYRQYQLPLAFRVGLLQRLEGGLTLPFTHAEQEFSFAGESVKDKTSGIGDAALRLNYDLLRETALRPDLVATLNVRAPSGDTPDESGVSTGSGHWAGSLGLQFIKTVDPIVLFWGLGYTHEFASTHFYNDGVYDVQPGESLDYNFGFGFAVNDAVSLSAQVSGAYQWETEADGREISGSDREPVSVRSALTYRVSGKLYLEPFLTIGLNDDVPDFSMGIAGARRFGGE